MKPEKQSNYGRSVLISVVLSLIILMSIFLWITQGNIEAIASILAVLTGAALFGGIIIAIYTLMASTFRSPSTWTEPPATSNKKAKALGVDYINETVHYSTKRLGDKQRLTGNTEKGSFIIDGDYITVGDIAFSKQDIQWLGLIKRSNFVRLDVNIDAWWYQINIDPGYDGDDFLKELRKKVSDKLNQSRYTRRPEIRTYIGVPAHITTQNLQGIFEKHEQVELHITPLWLIVLNNGYVMQQHFIDDITDMRCSKHPTALDDDMLLLSFEVGEEAFAYALKDKNFATRLSDARKEGVDSNATRKKKHENDLM